MASLFKEQSKLSQYWDRRFPGSQEEFEQALLASTTVYIGNMSFYTTEEQVYELFSRAGEIKKIIMGLDKNTKTPCGFCFVLYYSREDTEDAVKYISGTILDDRPIRVDFDWGFQEGRQWGRGRSGGQVRDEYRTDYDPDILLGGYGKLVQKELEAQRSLVDYGTGSLGSFPPVMPPHCKLLETVELFFLGGGGGVCGLKTTDLCLTATNRTWSFMHCIRIECNYLKGLQALMVDMEEARITGVLIGLLEIILGNGTAMMTATHMTTRRETRILNRGRTLITNLDQRKIHGFVRVVTLMKMKMSKSGELNQIPQLGIDQWTDTSVQIEFNGVQIRMVTELCPRQLEDMA
ncbi:unnamed protein product [Malus baccata var. baccata]